jgi:vancomycin resistance protein YoaR
MNKHLVFRISPLAVALSLIGVVLAFVLGLYGLNRVMSRGEVMGHAEVAGTPIGGLTEDQAYSELVGVEEQYASRPSIMRIEGKFVSLDPRQAGFDLNDEAIVEEAMAIGRNGNPISEFSWWLTHIFSTEELELKGSVQPAAVDAVFDEWDTQVIANPADPGSISLVGEGIPTASYPRTGTGIDRAPSVVLIEVALLSVNPIETTIPTRTIEAELDRADVDAALAEAEQMLSANAEMTYDDSSVEFDEAQLIAAFRSETITKGTAHIVNSFDPTVVDEYLAPVRNEFEDEPVDAVFRVRGESVSVIPGKNGTLIDAEETASRLGVATLTESRRGRLPIVEGAAPDVTTEYLESLNVNHMVSQFTTYHPCCADRVANIQQMADDVRGVLVLPGETFSLNGYVGERTEAKGYLPAGTIIAGEFTDTVGGGVSQFATTLYSAVFWGGYEDVEHRAHSYYFTRYPEGIEATVNWTTPDLKFRNNRSHAVLLSTVYSDESITVRLFGDNDGRTLKGEQSDGSRKVWVSSEGGDEALHVKGDVSDRFAETEPGDDKYIGNPEFDENELVEIQNAAGGWSVTVTRRILLNGETVVEEKEWVVRYAPRFALYEVHPCMVPGTSTICPSETTTTTPPPSTTVAPSTTVPPETTTTVP